MKDAWEVMDKLCPKCGKIIVPKSSFCSECGSKVRDQKKYRRNVAILTVSLMILLILFTGYIWIGAIILIYIWILGRGWLV